MKVTAKMSGSLDALKKGLDKANSGEFAAKFCQRAADATLELVQQEFDTSTDPYGDGWPEPQAGNTPMILSGALSASFTPVATGDSFGADAGTDYAIFLQSGTRRMDPRMMFPEDDMPPAWDERYTQIAEDTLNEMFDNQGEQNNGEGANDGEGEGAEAGAGEAAVVV